ncbi:hypothetical protein F4779DRAFT_633365 [Xylariaceae sp. FL0662B]|nr:hypothetical protein F4779DRAFT_633365 [Xylariaceae sp. FL0662B]
MRTRKQTPIARLLRQVVIVCVVCLALYCFLRMPPDASLDSSRTMADTFPQSSKGRKPKKSSPPPPPLNNRFLTEAQCAAAFPGLTKEIDDAVAQGPFTLERNPHGLGPSILRIKDGKLSILSYARKSDLSRDMLAHRGATLHQVANALLTAPAPLPDTVIAFNHGDEPLPRTWSYSRPADPSLLTSSGSTSGSKHYFAIPHFGFYSWPLPFIGSFARAADAIRTLEDEEDSPTWWDAKRPLAVWRGTAHYNAAGAGRMRQNLLAAARGRSWADVEALRWTATPQGRRNATNALPIEDFCRYRYVVHTEGVTYSGRFQMHQLCASVVLTPPLAWVQHATHLVRPLFSHALEGDGVARSPVADLGAADRDHLAPYPAPWVRAAWPRGYGPDEANIVFVAPDWSDLEATVTWLERHPQIAEGIARRQRELFDGGGYFSPAAEMCYWRALIRGWSTVAKTDGQGFEDLEAVPWEEFSLTEIHK